MRNNPTALEKRIGATLAVRRAMRYGAIMTTVQVGSPLLARTLRRMQQRGTITRTVVTEALPPYPLYALAKAEPAPAAE